ncbi:AMP-binding protein [Kribbella sp. NPDC051620]|uniref:AMP-binding protein n=1 Tax=Kribbella sp. NPDC051620 TaxID=3364120 RepID=UPI003792564C
MEFTPSAHQDTFTRDHLPPERLWPTLEFTLPELQYPDRLNAATVLINETVERFGADRQALLTPAGETWTYGEVLLRANQVAQVLTEDVGIVPGERVLLRSPNNPWTVICWLAVLKAGGVVVTTMAALRARELLPLIERTRPAVALVDHRFAEELRIVQETGTFGLPLIEYGGAGPRDLITLASVKSGQFTDVDTAADDVALLCPTSGTTGVPKLTMHYHRDVLAISDTFGRHIMQLRQDDVVSCTAPLAFTFGLGALVIFPFRVGAAALLTEAATPRELAGVVHDRKATVLCTAPTAYRAILLDGLEHLLSGVRMAVSAGEHLPLSTWIAMRDRAGLRIVDGIGSTEMLHIFISACGDAVRPGATGRPVPGYRATILDDEGRELGDNEPGRLAVIGPTGCRYLDDERQENYVVNGWNVTGDTFYRDSDGYFHYQARTDNMIVSSGYNIGGPEVEEAVVRHADVMECAVVGRPDENRGAVVCAFVVLREGVAADDSTRRAIQDFVKQEIAPYKYPRDVRFVDTLPRNPSGKVEHFRLRQLASAEPGQAGTPAAR